ncbi:hypothetical protein BZA05DRAFT_406632 [Tricharina praecox]|uniref:uncharacterized protein n=1 Tax=Tricharina praecox TaxID=43433 RepID=UPI002221267B|nr:uncharacterized protein BZA05DRAFT_406632 [Tricharina praecox]KAI5846791.1 hypothetical protein BZA05DRAFT_406632 [Tricharina praecox]
MAFDTPSHSAPSAPSTPSEMRRWHSATLPDHENDPTIPPYDPTPTPPPSAITASSTLSTVSDSPPTPTTPYADILAIYTRDLTTGALTSIFGQCAAQISLRWRVELRPQILQACFAHGQRDGGGVGVGVRCRVYVCGSGFGSADSGSDSDSGGDSDTPASVLLEIWEHRVPAESEVRGAVKFPVHGEAGAEAEEMAARLRNVLARDYRCSACGRGIFEQTPRFYTARRLRVQFLLTDGHEREQEHEDGHEQGLPVAGAGEDTQMLPVAAVGEPAEDSPTAVSLAVIIGLASALLALLLLLFEITLWLTPRVWWIICAQCIP